MKRSVIFGLFITVLFILNARISVCEDGMVSFFDEPMMPFEKMEDDIVLQTSWESDEKTKTLVITQEDAKNNPLNIEVKGGIISINGKQVKKEQIKDKNGNVSTTYFSSTVSQIMPVPDDVIENENKLEIKDNTINLIFNRNPDYKKEMKKEKKIIRSIPPIPGMEI